MNTVDYSSAGEVMVDEWHTITVKFPRGGYLCSFEEAPTSVIERFISSPKVQRGLTIMRVRLRDGAQVTIVGFGMPFANADDTEVEGWVNESRPIVENYTLMDILSQRNFTIILTGRPEEATRDFAEESLPPPFVFPYGSEQGWNEDLFKELIRNNKGSSFHPIYS